MDDDIERLAKIIHDRAPVTIDGKALAWEHVVCSHPDQAVIYREAAANRIKAEEAMKRLEEQPAKGVT